MYSYILIQTRSPPEIPHTVAFASMLPSPWKNGYTPGNKERVTYIYLAPRESNVNAATVCSSTCCSRLRKPKVDSTPKGKVFDPRPVLEVILCLTMITQVKGLSIEHEKLAQRLEDKNTTADTNEDNAADAPKTPDAELEKGNHVKRTLSPVRSSPSSYSLPNAYSSSQYYDNPPKKLMRLVPLLLAKICAAVEQANIASDVCEYWRVEENWCSRNFSCLKVKTCWNCRYGTFVS